MRDPKPEEALRIMDVDSPNRPGRPALVRWSKALVLLVVGFAAVGCQHQRSFRVVDAESRLPISGVTTTAWSYTREILAKGGEESFELSPTGAEGLATAKKLSSAQQYVFTFSHDGYRDAALNLTVPGFWGPSTALLVSPVPAKEATPVKSASVIEIPMFRRQ
jgi:hypothetical protein